MEPMDMTQTLVDLTPIIKAAIILFAELLLALVVPRVRALLKAKCNAEDLQRMEFWVRVGVQAAEQLFDAVEGPAKLEFVKNFLKEKGYDISMPELVNAIESEVLRLHRGLAYVEQSES